MYKIFVGWNLACEVDTIEEVKEVLPKSKGYRVNVIHKEQGIIYSATHYDFKIYESGWKN